jgi:hypothetical protein
MTTDERKQARAATWKETGKEVRLVQFYGTGADVQWTIETAEGESHLVHELELRGFI